MLVYGSWLTFDRVLPLIRKRIRSRKGKEECCFNKIIELINSRIVSNLNGLLITISIAEKKRLVAESFPLIDNSIKEKKSRVEKLVVDETIGRRRRGNCIEFLDNSAFSPPPLSLRFPPFSGNGTSANTSWARVNCADRLSSRFHSTERRINCIFRWGGGRRVNAFFRPSAQREWRSIVGESFSFPRLKDFFIQLIHARAEPRVYNDEPAGSFEFSRRSRVG